jgi:hypothetical protein
VAVTDTVWYEGPSGDEFIPNPTAEQMREVLGREYESYWGPYSPVGLLVWHRHPLQEHPTRDGLGTATQLHQLLFVVHPDRGFYFEYDDLVPYDPLADRGEWVEHWACGELMFFRAACFVPREVAERIVAEFLGAARPSPLVSWSRYSAVRSRLSPDEWRARR